MTPEERERKALPTPHDVAFKLAQHMPEEAAKDIAQYVYQPLRAMNEGGVWVSNEDAENFAELAAMQLGENHPCTQRIRSKLGGE